MIAYKGFNRNEDGTLSCHNMVYEPGKTYKHEGEIELCESGFHACHELWQVWPFYQNDGNNIFYEVECGGEIIDCNGIDGKFVCSEITLVKEVDMSNIARFDGASYFSRGVAWVRKDRKCNYIDTKGKLLSERWFDYVDNFSEGFARVKLDDKWNFISTDGKMLSEKWFNDAVHFNNSFARVKLNRKWNFIGTNGKFLSEQWFDNVGYFSEGSAAVKIDGKWNFINAEGKLLSEQWFDGAWSFLDGFAMVKLNGKWVKINKNRIFQNPI